MKEGFFTLKRWLCGVLALLLVLFVAACDAAGSSPAVATAAPPPPATAAPRDPIQITEQPADIQTVESAEPQPTASAAPVETPSTGELPLVPVVGAVGLILLCSAGLVMLRRI